ncbi:non-specific serine/threonine protein kinase [Micromonospora pattaloongensis]|uniref:Non-specific serine/threonine protein kinase n=1 Tax=Micromonospora pattaloongensis TaxID=405436 RepID=A0A1H3PTX4_9ACTN|nr:DEAD/DEAH box helicase [Micromonospora pattaloongensis]SDZ04486.1 non-specific serine/threonine protein kinase [Micromonospora pattaloongensis]
MLVVHGLWLAGGRLALWAEDSTLPERPPGRPGRPPRERPHPFAAAHTALAEALGESATTATTGIRPLTLPTRAGAPVESPELVRAEPAAPGRAAVTLVPWRVPTLEYDADDALPLLRTIHRDTGLPGAVPGAGPRHLAQLAEFALDLVARGRTLPGLDGDRAVWRPLLTGADAGWARALAMALPPAVKAASPGPADPSGPDGVEPRLGAAELVADALDRLTDAAARVALEGVRLTEARRGTGTDAAVRGWLRALTGRERTVAGPPGALAELDRELRGWQRDAAGGAVRACFRMVEPAVGDDDERWRLEFALQAADEPSLVVAADRIWAAQGELPGLARHLDAPEETLLGELGRASRLWPGLETALRTAMPEALDLDSEGAHRFLRDGAPILHAAGFGVLLPSWWQRPGARLGARVAARTRTAPGTVAARSSLGLESLVDYRWELALGDQPLTEDELKGLAALKTPLVRLRGQWVEVDPKRIAAGLRLLRSAGEMTVGDLLRLGLELGDEPDALPVLGVTADGALGDLLAGRAERHLAPVDEPPGFRGTLRPYQKRGLAWLSFLQSLGLGGVLADDMGLGKTVQILSLLARDEGTGPTLLVCPMSLVGNWQREAAKFAPELRVHVHHGAERPRGPEFTAAVRDADLVVTTYSIAARDAADLAVIEWHRVVVDEAQAIKNAATRQAVAVRALPARHRIAVTGTPVENRLADLWSIMDFANPGLLGAAPTFKKRYAEPIERHGDDEAAQRLRRITGPFVLRRVKSDKSIISDLPEKLEMEVLCNLTAEQASLYQAVVDDMLARIESSEGIERRGLVLATMTKLKQVCNHPAQLLRDGSAMSGRSGKLARLEELLDEVLAAGEKALLFTQYAEFGNMLRAHLSARLGREVLFLHGAVGKAARDELVARFQTDAGPPLFVLSLKAGGTGLTLTAANHVVHVDRWWNPAVEDQATDRAFRIGQRRAVQVRKFVCAGTVEEKISAMIGEKRGLAARIVGTGEQWLTELSTSELRRLFALEAGAVVE